MTPGLGRTVAVKIMRADLANDDIFLARFRREAHAVAQMNNPNIVNIYDSGEELVSSESGDAERLPYIVMDTSRAKPCATSSRSTAHSASATANR